MDGRSSRRIGETDNSRATFHGYVLWSTRSQTQDVIRPWRDGVFAPNGKAVVDKLNPDADWLSQNEAEEHAEGLARHHAAKSGNALLNDTKPEWKTAPYGG